MKGRLCFLKFHAWEAAASKGVALVPGVYRLRRSPSVVCSEWRSWLKGYAVRKFFTNQPYKEPAVTKIHLIAAQ